MEYRVGYRLIIGKERLCVAHLILLLIDLFPQNIQSLTRRLNKLLEKPETYDNYTQKWLESYQFSPFIASNKNGFSLQDDMVPFWIVSAYFMKGNMNRDRILGLFEVYHILVRRIGVSGMPDKYIVLAKHFIDLATNAKFDQIPNMLSPTIAEALQDDPIRVVGDDHPTSKTGRVG